MFLKTALVIFALVLLNVGLNSAQSEPRRNTPFRLCEGRNGTAQDIDVDVSECDSTEFCPLYRGTTHTITLKFTPTNDIKTIERLIIAKFPDFIRGKPLEIPYGSAVDACAATKKDSDDTDVCAPRAIVPNDRFTHVTAFPVFSSAPTKKSLWVRYILRERINRPGSRRRMVAWKDHPGKLICCVEIPVQIV